MKVTHEGPATGVGASYAWTGNKKVGEGRMTITESRPGERVSLRLEFIKPFKSTSDTSFVFTPEGDGTRVTWTYAVGGYAPEGLGGLAPAVDRMLGAQLEALKSYVEQNHSG